jgi:hypothetical protein
MLIEMFDHPADDGQVRNASRHCVCRFRCPATMLGTACIGGAARGLAAMLKRLIVSCGVLGVEICRFLAEFALTRGT